MKFCALMLLTVPAVLSAQKPIRSGVFVTTLGKDTMSIERYTRTEQRLEGEIVTPVPRAIVVRYTLDFDAAGNARELNLIGRLAGAPENAPPLLERKQVIVGDSVITDVRRSGQVDANATGRLPIAKGSLPFISNSTAITEEIGHQFRRAGVDSTGFSLFVFGAQGVGPATPIVRFKGDTLMINNGPGQTPLVYLDRQGRLQKVDNRLTTVQTVTRRVSDVDMARVVERFAAMGMVGIPSPRDTARADLSGATLTIDYGRPRARGRQVFGGMVPLEQVWRTGANLATHFTTSRDLQFGEQRVPAGSYTLWTLPSAAGDTLIISKQTGQWGTQYNAANDLMRIPLRTEQTRAHTEQFMIAIEPAAGGGVLVLTWERRRMRAPFRIVS